MRKRIDYALSDELMGQMEDEFRIGPLIENYRKALEGIDENRKEAVAEDVFGTFGRNLAERILALEDRYRDRTAEVAYRIADQTGHPFPAYLQRPLEIGILSIMNANKWHYDEISYKRLAYVVTRCVIHQAIEQSLGKALADEVPCRFLCLGLYETLCENTMGEELVRVNMTSKISHETDRCSFEALYSHPG
ncbi:MAG: hypothetical protein ABII26_05340 [Pseudomonadota bacterium]